MRAISYACLCLVLALSCATTRQSAPVTEELGASAVERIEALIGQGKTAQAFQSISLYRSDRKGVVPPEKLASLEQLVVAKTRETFSRNLEAKEYDLALVQLHNLNLLGPAEIPAGWNRDRILSLKLQEYLSGGNPVLALHTFFRIAKKETLARETLKLLAEQAVRLEHREAGRALAAAYPDAPEEVKKSLKLVVERQTNPAELVKSTVTIWVNRGIKIERGIGLPDRVIGSGFFIDPRGYLITNYHVIDSEVNPKYEGYSRLFIKLSDQADYKIPAKVIGYDKILDLALLKAETDVKSVVSIVPSPQLKTGSRVYAVGSPAGLENTVTSGIISATGRRFLQIGEAVQIDVPVNPGSSGGPLVDEQAGLVGVVFAGIEQFQGLNFAIPAVWLERFLPRLYREGEAGHAWLGLSVAETSGAYEVLYVDPGSPAASAGIQAGDLIDQFQDQRLASIPRLQEAINELENGMLVSLVTRRKQETRRIILALDARPFSPLENRVESLPRADLFPTLFGFRAESTGAGIFSEDFIITKVFPGSSADEAGLSENDPFTLRRWQYDKKNRAIIIQLSIKKRKTGFLEGEIQLGSYIDANNFI